MGLHRGPGYRPVPRRRTNRRRIGWSAAHGAIGGHSSLGSAAADRGRRERVLVLVFTLRGVATRAAGIVVAVNGPVEIVYVLAALPRLRQPSTDRHIQHC